ncbi:uncharacterized protein [Panulirus ornatus]|uniref:uncharacterized protein isoform X2 n=1 Tax=Panulirus ornatus TaxID=150431 RepID=UPI003A8A45F8
MEDADVKQLISLIESAQLQYEVDEAGTVSIVCDPVQLVGSSEEIDGTVLAANEDNNAASILNQNLEDTLVTEEDDGKEVPGIMAITPREQESEENLEVNKDLPEDNEDKSRHEDNDQKACQEEGSQQESGPQLQLSPSGHYFFQTPDGQIMQVLGSLDEDVNEGSILEEAQALVVGNKSNGQCEGADAGVQIFVVGNNSGEDVFLINAPDRDIEDESRSPFSVSSVMLKNDNMTEVDQEATLVNGQTQAVHTLTSKNVMNSTPELDAVPIYHQEDKNSQGIFLKDSTKIAGLETLKSLTKNTSGDTSIQMSCAPSVSTKDPLLCTLPRNKHYIRLNSKTKPKLPLKVQISSNTLGEGTVVHTDRGEMIAHNLSSVAEFRQTGPNGQKTTLQNIASACGSMVKVLRPVDTKKEHEVNKVNKRFSLLTCEDCGATLHSERSLQIHRHRYHKEWDDECFICGKKFLNMQYVRSHIQEVHSMEESFECRLCSYKCTVLKEILRHRKIHEKSQVCDKCGKKYITPKIYREHVLNCKVKGKIDSKRKSVCLENSVNERESKKEKEYEGSNLGDDFDMEHTEQGKKVMKDTINSVIAEKVDENNAALNTLHTRKKSAKNSSDLENIKNDVEFKVKSKHYHQQIKRMTIEQKYQRTNRAGRDRTHRCYLCFKLFPSVTDLDAHKESYHLAKSDRPVRVKTDTTLDEKEEDLVESSTSFFDETAEEVQVKVEPVDMLEEFENVTIILDESMKSTQVIKPQCIACGVYTNIDFRKFSKWFNKIPHGDQSDALKKFQQFFPCVIDAQSLVEPWVLCKKCVHLIDRISDIEDKLNSVKCDLISRLRSRVEDQHVIDKNSIPSEKYPNQVTLSGEIGSETHDTNIAKHNMIEGIGKSLADIEAYMKDTCEIMEITKPRKRPGRPRKQEKEKWTPVLVSDEVERACMKGMVKFITKDIVKKEKENMIDVSVKNGTCSKEAKCHEKQITRTPAKLMEQVQIKEEPTQNDIDSMIPNSESASWTEVTGNSPSSLTALQEEQFYVENSDLSKKDQSNSESCLEDILMKRVEGKIKDSHVGPEEECQMQCEDESNLNSENSCEINNSVSSKHLTLSSNSAVRELDTGDDDDLQCHSTSKRRKPDMPLLKTEDGSTDDNSSIESQGDKDKQRDLTKFMGGLEEFCADGEEQHSSTAPPGEDGNTNKNKLFAPKSRVLGRKRAQIHEERKKMCYRVEGASTKPWICSECHKGFSSQRGACDHFAASHKGQNFACEYCSASYVRKRDLIGHYNKVHLNIKPYKCKVSECTETFSSHGQLYRHLQSAHSIQKAETSFTCHLCFGTFAEKRYRDAHIPVCASKGSDSVPHKCPLCEKAFKLPRYLQLHMRTVHCWKNEQFLCEICNKVLTDKRNLVIHMKSHMGETKTTCEICGKQFNRKSYLWTHMRVHTNQRPYGCNYCSKWFKQYSTWKNHERTHTGEKPYKCFICEANFSTSSSVTKHVQYAHCNIREYSCEICKKTFITKPKLDEHMKVHTGEKPYKCPICNRAFNKKNNLHTHMYVHSTNKRYKCELCGEGFMRRTAIENHILDQHKVDCRLGSTNTRTNTEIEGGIVVSSTVRRTAIDNHILDQHKLDLILDANNVNPNVEKEGGTVVSSTAPFISVVGAEDLNTEDSYIVIYADEEEERDSSKEMQVTILAENESSQVQMPSKQVPLSSGFNEVNSSVKPTSSVLSEVIPEEDPSVKRAETITALIPDVSPISMQECNDSNITQVMEIDPAHFRLVTSEDSNVPMFSG